MARLRVLGAWVLLVWASCQEASPGAHFEVVGPDGLRPPNVLVVLFDDVGVELVGAYGHLNAAQTPNLDALAGRGVVFETAWATPLCSSTRAALITGQHPRRFGIGAALALEVDTADLPDEAVTLPELLGQHAGRSWHSAYVGKWHLTLLKNDPAGAPQRQGFDHFVGSIGNLTQKQAIDGKDQNYRNWERVVDGKVEREKQHATRATLRDARNVIRDLDEPWVVVVALHAVHTPWHDPPGTTTTEGREQRAAHQVRAMLTDADAALGKMLDDLDADVLSRTLVMATSDNGSTDNAFLGDLIGKAGKATVRELGVRVPLIVAGPGVAQGHTTALAHVVDIVPTVLELAGVQPARVAPELEGLSFLPALRSPQDAVGHPTLFTEVFVPNGPGPYVRHERTVRDDRWRLIRGTDGVDRLWEIGEALVEGNTVGPTSSPEARAAYARLTAVLDRYGTLGAQAPSEVQAR